MKAEEIKLALRMVMHGRVNHPEVERLCEALEAVFATKTLDQMAGAMREAVAVADEVMPKRGPGRPKKEE